LQVTRQLAKPQLLSSGRDPMPVDCGRRVTCALSLPPDSASMVASPPPHDEFFITATAKKRDFVHYKAD
jgi:hypothetical protein